MNEVKTLWDLDLELFRAIHVGMHREWLDFWISMITWTGLGSMQAAFLIVAIYFFRDQRLNLWRIATAGIIAGILRAILMRLADRVRPSNLPWAHPQEPIFGNTSFPSGHATGTFAIAIALWLTYRKTDYAWVGNAAIVWACLVAFSRVYLGVHFPTDVVGGAGLGAFCAGAVFLAWPKKESN
jgi:undecaprenyl-diphosphatase